MPKEDLQGAPCHTNTRAPTSATESIQTKPKTATPVVKTSTNSTLSKVKDVRGNVTSNAQQPQWQKAKLSKPQPGSFEVSTSSRNAPSNLCKCGDKCVLCGQYQSFFATPDDHCTEVLNEMLQCYGLSIDTCTSNDLMVLLREQIDEVEKADRDIACCKTFIGFMTVPKNETTHTAKNDCMPDLSNKSSQLKTWEGLLQQYADLKLDPPPESTDVAKSFRHKFLIESVRIKKRAKRRVPKARNPDSEMRQNEYVNSTLLKFADWMNASQDKLILANSIRSHKIKLTAITQLVQMGLSMEQCLNEKGNNNHSTSIEISANLHDGRVAMPDQKTIMEILESIKIDKINLKNKFDSVLGEFVGVAGERSEIKCTIYEKDTEKVVLKSKDCQTDTLSEDEYGKFITLDPSIPLVEVTHTMLKTYGTASVSATLECEGLDFIPRSFTNPSKK